jgi:hypothetical protein
MATYQPFLGNFATYGSGPEHQFFLEGLLTGNDLTGGAGASDVPLPPYDGPLDNGSGGGTGGGQAGLGIGPGLGDDGRSANANESTATTDSLGGLLGSVIGAPVGPIGALSLFGNVAFGKNEPMSKMGLFGLAESILGLDNPVDKSFEGFAEQSDLSMSPTDMSFAGFAETSDAYGGVDSSGAGSGVGGGGGGPGGGNGSDGSSGTGAGSSGDSGPGGGPGGYADGGFIPGDAGGMDDTVPATIDGLAPAALSSGEFVVPADIVSAIGDGNTNAGAKKLQSAMAAIRKEKYGRAKQPPKLKQRTLANLLA